MRTTQPYKLDSEFFTALRKKKLVLVNNGTRVKGHARYEVKCSLCLSEFIAWHKTILDTNSPACLCRGHQKQGSASQHRQWLRDNLPNLKLVGEYNGIDGNAAHRCKCGHEFNTRPYSLRIAKGNGCPICSRRKTQKERSAKKAATYSARLQAKDCTMLPVENYINATTAVKHRCTSCDYERTVTPDYMLRLAKCTNCCAKNKKKTVITKGKTFVVYGVEDRCLELLRARYRYSEIEAFNSGKVPIIPYGKGRRYMPDFFVKKDNMIVEAKGLATFGMRPFPRSKKTQSEMFYECCEKAKATLAAGYRYAFCLIDDDGERIRLPTNWYDLGFREMKRLLA